MIESTAWWSRMNATGHISLSRDRQASASISSIRSMYPDRRRRSRRLSDPHGGHVERPPPAASVGPTTTVPPRDVFSGPANGCGYTIAVGGSRGDLPTEPPTCLDMR